METSTTPFPNIGVHEAISPLDETQCATSIRSENGLYSGNAITGSVSVVIQRRHKRFFLLPLRIRASATSKEVMTKLRETKNQEVSRIKILKPIRQTLWKTVIEIVNLSTVSDRPAPRDLKSTNKPQFHLPDVEAQPSQLPLEVIVSSRTPSAELTAAFHRSCILQSSASFADQYPALLSSSPSRSALLIGQKLNKCAICWVVLATLFISLVIGLLVD